MRVGAFAPSPCLAIDTSVVPKAASQQGVPGAARCPRPPSTPAPRPLLLSIRRSPPLECCGVAVLLVRCAGLGMHRVLVRTSAMRSPRTRRRNDACATPAASGMNGDGRMGGRAAGSDIPTPALAPPPAPRIPPPLPPSPSPARKRRRPRRSCRPLSISGAGDVSGRHECAATHITSTHAPPSADHTGPSICT
eukprot:28224-Chlamydomonas_euryale.AAC.5